MQTNAKTLSDVPAINRFLSYCRVRTVPSKTVMIHAGDLPDVLYYIVDGSVEVMIEDEDGNEKNYCENFQKDKVIVTVECDYSFIFLPLDSLLDPMQSTSVMLCE